MPNGDDDVRPVEQPPFYPGGGGSGAEGYPYTPNIPPEGVPADYLPAVPGPGYTGGYAPATAPAPAPAAPEIPGVPSPGPAGDLVSTGFIGGPGFAGGAPFYEPGRGRLSERQLARLLGEQVPGGLSSLLGGILGGRGIFRGTYRRPALATVARRALRVIVRRAIERFTPTNVPPKGGLPTVYEAAARSPLRGLGVLGGLILAGRPTVLGRGDLTPEQVLYYSLNPIRVRARMIGMGPSPFPLGQPVNVSVSRLLGQLPPLPPPARRPDESFRGFLRRELQGLGRDFGYDWLRQQVPGLPVPRPSAREQREVGPPEPRPIGPIIEPTPTGPVPGVPQVSIPPVPRVGRRARRVVSPRIRLGVGALLAGLAVEALRPSRGAAPATSVPAPTPIVGPGLSPTPPPVMAPLTALNAGFVGYGGTTSTCRCRPRGPRRKCLQRAPVRWAGGPRKGKAAGTRCIRYKGST